MTYSNHTPAPRPDRAALATLVILQGLMLAALYTGTPPHPPQDIFLFALGPFLSAAVALGVAAIMLDGLETFWGRGLTLAAVGAALVSFGPQKWFAASFGDIWPAVGIAQICCAVLIGKLVGPVLPKRADDPANARNAG
jgi:hypothetical protein